MSRTFSQERVGADRARWKSIAFRAGAVALGLLPFLLCELILRMGGAGDPPDDSFVEFAETRPLFVLSEDGARYEIPASRLRYFRPQSFAAVKDSRAFRIFVLGGSTVQGRPFSVQTSFPAWLELSLHAADSRRDWEVVNCGGVSYASYRLAPILDEILNHSPDLVILYTGHNEFLEERTYRAVADIPPWRRAIHRRLSRWRTFEAARRLFRRGPATSASDGAGKPTLAAETDALLDYQEGLKAYRRDDAARALVIAHYEDRIRNMLGKAEKAGVPVVVMNPVSNLKDSPPFKASHGDHAAPADRSALNAVWQQARTDGLPAEERIRYLVEALSIDDRHAGLHFHLGLVYHAEGRYAEAKAAFIRAKEEDLCPLRMLEPMHQALSHTMRQYSASLVDVRGLFEQLTDDAIPGSEWLLDHVHPSIRGHQEIARVLMAEMVELGLAQLEPDWQARRDVAYQEQFAALDDAYHARGQRRLRRLQRWAQGYGDKVKNDEISKYPSTKE